MTSLRDEAKLMLPSIPGKFVWDALAAYCYRGGDAQTLLEPLGLDQALLKAEGSRVSVLDYANLMEQVIDTLEDGFLGFADKQIPKRSFSVFASSLPACQNLNQVLIQFNRFYALFSDQFELTCEQQAPTVKISLNFRETQPFDYRFIYQSILVVLLRLVHWLLGENIRPRRVGFSFDDRALTQHFEYLFDCPILFCQSRNFLEFDDNILAWPIVTNLEQINEMLRDSRRMMLVSHRPAPFTRQVRQTLIQHWRDQWLSIESVARGMGISENLLWRKLKKEGTNFLSIRDDVKRDLALVLVGKPADDFVQIAEQLGYADVSSFHKAFKGWTGQTPSKYRRQIAQA